MYKTQTFYRTYKYETLWNKVYDKIQKIGIVLNLQFVCNMVSYK